MYGRRKEGSEREWKGVEQKEGKLEEGGERRSKKGREEGRRGREEGKGRADHHRKKRDPSNQQEPSLPREQRWSPRVSSPPPPPFPSPTAQKAPSTSPPEKFPGRLSEAPQDFSETKNLRRVRNLEFPNSGNRG
jgi:hypothetical protein